MAVALFVAILGWAQPDAAHGQNSTTEVSRLNFSKASAYANNRATPGSGTSNTDQDWNPVLSPQAAAADSFVAMSLSYHLAKLDYDVESLEHKARVFRHHHVTSIFIFGLVVVIILSGLTLSFLQFRKDLVSSKEGSQTNIRLGKEGVEISSSVLGLLILLLSLGFFYLYLVQVYTLRELG